LFFDRGLYPQGRDIRVLLIRHITVSTLRTNTGRVTARPFGISYIIGTQTSTVNTRVRIKAKGFDIVRKLEALLVLSNIVG
jgi:hypothetical protein